MISHLLDPVLIERLSQLQLSARRVVEGATTGQHRSPLKGASVEFRQHRFYVPGDEPRRLDWRILARTDRPYVKEYDEETNLRCQLLLDCSGSMAYRGRGVSKFDYAAQVVASLAYVMLGQTESVGLTTFADRVQQFLKPHGGTPQLSRIVDLLERSAANGTADVRRAMCESADRLGRRGLVIIVSDFFAPIETLRAGLARLHHGRHEVVVLRVLDRDEIEFPFNRWTRFHGLEAEPAQLCEPAVMRETYLRNFKAHEAAITQTCRAFGFEFHTLKTDHSLADALVEFLQRRTRS